MLATGREPCPATAADSASRRRTNSSRRATNAAADRKLSVVSEAPEALRAEDRGRADVVAYVGAAPG